jgi:phosphoribosylamine--glycine ligase
MRILVVGSGGREHALAWKLRQSPRVREVFCAPGNGGMGTVATCVPIQAGDLHALLAFAREHAIGLTVVGPEAPLSTGIVDLFEQHGLRVFGACRAAAEIEGSKTLPRRSAARIRQHARAFTTPARRSHPRGWNAAVVRPTAWLPARGRHQPTRGGRSRGRNHHGA